MTREEAIGHIKDVICENNTIKPNIVVFEREKEALYMAIKALEQDPCEDCISRQAVLDEINEWIKSGEYGYTNATYYLRKRIDNLKSVNPQKLKTDVLDKLDEIITDALDNSTDQKESQTLRWVLDKISEVT